MQTALSSRKMHALVYVMHGLWGVRCTMHKRAHCFQGFLHLSSSEAPVMVAIVKEGGIGCVLRLMRHHMTNGEILLQYYKMLVNLCDLDETRLALVKEGGVSHMVQALKRHPRNSELLMCIVGLLHTLVTTSMCAVELVSASFQQPVSLLKSPGDNDCVRDASRRWMEGGHREWRVKFWKSARRGYVNEIFVAVSCIV